jgi:hypothetical protein
MRIFRGLAGLRAIGPTLTNSPEDV